MNHSHLAGHFRNAAKMIEVIMRVDVMIDLLQTGHFPRHFYNPAGVTAARVSGIDQEALFPGRNDESRTPTLRINPEDLEGRVSTNPGTKKKKKRQQRNERGFLRGLHAG